MSFEEELDAFYVSTMAKVNKSITEVIQLVAISVVDKTPVGNPSIWQHASPPAPWPKVGGYPYVPGALKANWRGQIDEIDYTVTDDTDPSGEMSIANIFAAIPAQLVGHNFYISNSLSHAIPIENGHSKQAPAGMVGLTAVEFQNIANTVILKNASL